jgi:hypothetical protein
MFYFPNLAPVVIAGLIWLFLVDPDFGAFNLTLRAVGLPPQTWLGNTDLALPTIAALRSGARSGSGPCSSWPLSLACHVIASRTPGRGECMAATGTSPCR